MADCAPTLDHTPHGTANQANAKNGTAKCKNSDSTIHPLSRGCAFGKSTVLHPCNLHRRVHFVVCLSKAGFMCGRN